MVYAHTHQIAGGNRRWSLAKHLPYQRRSYLKSVCGRKILLKGADLGFADEAVKSSDPNRDMAAA